MTGYCVKIAKALMHTSSLLRMKWFVDNYLKGSQEKSVLDVGSYDVNGSYRCLFDDSKFTYVGLDMQNGPNVDYVPTSAYKWIEIEDDSFDVVISGQALEHIEFFWITVAEMVRVLKKDGLICIIAPNGFGEHRYPVDCWRFFSDGMVALARYVNLQTLHVHTNCAPSEENIEWFSNQCADSMLVARKPYSGEAQILDFKSYECIPADHSSLRGHFVSAPQIQTETDHVRDEAIITIHTSRFEKLAFALKSLMRRIINKNQIL